MSPMGLEPTLRAPLAVPVSPERGASEPEAGVDVRSPWPSDSRARSRWFFWGRLAFTLGLLALLFSRVDLGTFADAIRGALGLVLLVAVLSKSLALVISAAKWDYLLRGLGVRTSRWMLLEVYTMGFFVNAFLPGVVGGDVVRWQMAGRRTGERLKVAATIVAERATGLAALLVLSVPAALYLLPRSTLPLLVLAVFGVASVIAAGVAMALNRRLAISVLVRTRGTRVRRAARRLYGLHRTLRQFPRKPLLGAFGFSVLFYLSAGLTFFLVCRAFDTQMTLMEATSVQLLIMLLIMIPVSIGGLGLAQAGDVYLLGLLGIGAAEALGISMARMMVAYVYAVVGAFLFMRWQARPGPGRPTVDPARTSGWTG